MIDNICGTDGGGKKTMILLPKKSKTFETKEMKVDTITLGV